MGYTFYSLDHIRCPHSKTHKLIIKNITTWHRFTPRRLRTALVTSRCPLSIPFTGKKVAHRPAHLWSISTAALGRDPRNQTGEHPSPVAEDHHS